MPMQPYRILGAALGWFTITVQYGLSVSEAGFASGSADYFGYFTLWGNILVAFAFAATLLPDNGFLSRPGPRTAIAVYIVVVSVIYNLLLRGIDHPHGLGYVINLLLHDVMPALYVADWALFVDKRGLRFRQIPLWLAVPVAYAAMAMLRGAWTGYYPYPFLDAGRFGYTQIGVNIAGLAGFFILLSAGFVALGRVSAVSAPAGGTISGG